MAMVLQSGKTCLAGRGEFSDYAVMALCLTRWPAPLRQGQYLQCADIGARRDRYNIADRDDMMALRNAPPVDPDMPLGNRFLRDRPGFRKAQPPQQIIQPHRRLR